VKVLDFGLAKALHSESASGVLSHSPTLSVAATMQGVVLGTAAYMSPEQARGRAIDRSTDLWAFGCVLFEMLVGRRPFQGEDVTEIVAAVVKSEPDWSALPADTPMAMRTLLRQCLQKQPQQRLRDARSARLAVEAAMTEPSPAPADASRRTRAALWRLVVPTAAAALAIGALATWAVVAFSPVERDAARLLLDVAPAERLVGSRASRRPSRLAFALSPDGRTVVFTGVRGAVTQLYRRPLDELAATPMAGTEGARGPFFSPDGRWVGF
jgi:eukaryotic-like serine/threonine-protein kinase